MAETLISPGVLARESDQSFITQNPIQAGAAIIGPTAKGPVGIPTVVTSYSDYKSKYGAVVESGSDEYTYFTSIAAYNYFQQGGNTLLVTRVANGSYTSAISGVENEETETLGESATLSTKIDNQGKAEDEFRLELIDGRTFRFILADGSDSNGMPADAPLSNLYYIDHGSDIPTQVANMITTMNGLKDETVIKVEAADPDNINNQEIVFTSEETGIRYDRTKFGLVDDASDFDGGEDGKGSVVAFTLETLAEGEGQNSFSPEGVAGDLAKGTKDNLRWEITDRDTDKGTFTLLIRRGDDITNQKSILESYQGLSLDPNSPDYIARVIGDQKETVKEDDGTYYVEMVGTYQNMSRYVRVKSVTTKTLNYFNNAGEPIEDFFNSLPALGSGSFDKAEGVMAEKVSFYENIGSADTQGLQEEDYEETIALLANKDEYKYNLLLAPGLCRRSHPEMVGNIVNNCQSRGDTMAIIDMVFWGKSLKEAVKTAKGTDSSYAATYWPWVQTIDPDLGDQVWVPASTMMVGVYAFNDSSSEAWFAPAGLNRGGMSTVIRAERKLTNGNRDELYKGNVNPIATFPNTGVVVFGQKTLQKKPSALDRVNVRRLLIELKSYISQVADNLVFEQNSAATRNNFLTQVNPFMESVQQRQGLYAFKVIMDDSNNTPDVIDRNQMVGQIFIQPTKTAEFIYLDFNILPTGATFPA